MAASKRTLVIVAFAALYVIWGSTYLGIKFSIETIPPFLMAGARFVLAGVITNSARLASSPAGVGGRADDSAAGFSAAATACD